MSSFAFADDDVPPVVSSVATGQGSDRTSDPCPRCGGVLEPGLYGPCHHCRMALRDMKPKRRKR